MTPEEDKSTRKRLSFLNHLARGAVVATAATLGASVESCPDKAKGQQPPTHGATANGLGVSGRTHHRDIPLHLAARNGDMKLARLLIDKGADINAEDGWRRTPLHWATENCHTDLVKLLIDKGAEVNAKDDWQQTPLLWAVDAGHTDLAKLLIEKGANVNLGDSWGITPIYIAAYHGNTDLTRLLIAKGADVTATDKHGRTPLGMAAAGATPPSSRSLTKRTTSRDTPAKSPNAVKPLPTRKLVGRRPRKHSQPVKEDIMTPTDDKASSRHRSLIRRIAQSATVVMAATLATGADVTRNEEQHSPIRPVAKKGMTDVAATPMHVSC